MTSTFNQVLGIKPCEVFIDMSTVKIFREIHDHHEGTNAGQGQEPDSVGKSKYPLTLMMSTI